MPSRPYDSAGLLARIDALSAEIEDLGKQMTADAADNPDLETLASAAHWLGSAGVSIKGARHIAQLLHHTVLSKIEREGPEPIIIEQPPAKSPDLMAALEESLRPKPEHKVGEFIKQGPDHVWCEITAVDEEFYYADDSFNEGKITIRKGNRWIRYEGQGTPPGYVKRQDGQ